MQMFYRFAADFIVVFHAVYVLTVVLGQVLITIGAFRGWSWVRRWDLRIIHTAMILIVVLESWFGITCPLTTWEKQLREASGGSSYEGDFIADIVHEALFFELPNWAFTAIYTGFGLLVITSWWWCTPRRKTKVTDSARVLNQPSQADD